MAWKLDRERCPLAEIGVNRNLATVKTGQMFDDRKAESRTAYIACTTAIDAVKAFKNALKILGHDPLAGVGDRNQISVTGGHYGDGHGAGGPVELYRVVYQVRGPSAQDA